jgi:hypothetical protein
MPEYATVLSLKQPKLVKIQTTTMQTLIEPISRFSIEKTYPMTQTLVERPAIVLRRPRHALLHHLAAVWALHDGDERTTATERRSGQS